MLCHSIRNVSNGAESGERYPRARRSSLLSRDVMTIGCLYLFQRKKAATAKSATVYNKTLQLTKIKKNICIQV